MQALVDDDHRALGGIVEARHERALRPFIDVVAQSFRFGLDRLQRIVDDDEVRPLAGDRPLDSRRQTIAFGGGAQLDRRRPTRVEFDVREDRAVVRRAQEIAGAGGKILGEQIAIGRADDLPGRVAPENPRWQRDGGEQAFAMTRRNGDKQPADRALGGPLQHMCERAKVPRAGKGLAGQQHRRHQPVEAIEVLLGKAMKGLSVRRAQCAGVKTRHDECPPFAINLRSSISSALSGC